MAEPLARRSGKQLSSRVWVSVILGKFFSLFFLISLCILNIYKFVMTKKWPKSKKMKKIRALCFLWLLNLLHLGTSAISSRLWLVRTYQMLLITLYFFSCKHLANRPQLSLEIYTLIFFLNMDSLFQCFFKVHSYGVLTLCIFSLVT